MVKTKPFVINRKQFIKWLKALRSGNYNQTRGHLQDENGFCCLGVACKILIPTKKQEVDYDDDNRVVLIGEDPEDQPNAPKWLRNFHNDFLKRTGVDITDLNDTYHFSFEGIANVLERIYLKNKLLQWDDDKKEFIQFKQYPFKMV